MNMSSSSDNSEDPNSSLRSEQSLQEQEDALLAKFASVRHEIDSLVDDADSGNLFEGFEKTSTRQPVSPTLLREFRSSHFRSRSTEDFISGHQAVRHASLARSVGESYMSEVPVYESSVN